MQGLHLTADLFDCTCRHDLLADRGALQEVCIRLARRAGLSVVGDDFHQFAAIDGEPGGVTGLVLLAESHLAVHTWPELNAVTLDVYVCNFRQDNSIKAQTLCATLVELFAPERSNQNSLLRGVPQSPDSPDATHLALEWLTPDIVHGFARRRPPVATQTPFQRLEWHETRALGRTLVLDGAFMVAERDEFIYHECMVHVAALAHPSPRRALIMGGGDGCAARELLKHPSIERIVLAELDAAVIEHCRREFSHINQSALDDPRVEVVIDDALQTLRAISPGLDLVIMDLTDPDPASDAANPSAALYSQATYALIRSRLSAEGLVTAHIGNAFYHPERFRKTLADLRAVFTHVVAYKAYMPIYGAEWGMVCASMSVNPALLTATQVQQQLAARSIGDLRFYTPRVHASLFAWPAYAELLGA